MYTWLKPQVPLLVGRVMELFGSKYTRSQLSLMVVAPSHSLQQVSAFVSLIRPLPSYRFTRLKHIQLHHSRRLA